METTIERPPKARPLSLLSNTILAATRNTSPIGAHSVTTKDTIKHTDEKVPKCPKAQGRHCKKKRKTRKKTAEMWRGDRKWPLLDLSGLGAVFFYLS